VLQTEHIFTITQTVTAYNSGLNRGRRTIKRKQRNTPGEKNQHAEMMIAFMLGLYCVCSLSTLSCLALSSSAFLCRIFSSAFLPSAIFFVSNFYVAHFQSFRTLQYSSPTDAVYASPKLFYHPRCLHPGNNINHPSCYTSYSS